VDRFDFDFSSLLSWPLAAIGVTPWTAYVEVTDDDLRVRFGPWSLSTPRSNVDGASITGPYLPFRVIGPHISLADRGVTFGTSWQRGVCIRFREPGPAALPIGLLKHPGATVTVADPERLVATLERTPVGVPGEGDELHAVGVVADATPVATPPKRSARAGTGRTTTRGTGAATRTRTSTRTRTASRATAPAPEEHPTPADMPMHTDTEKVPGVTPPADENLPGPDSSGY
jgi:hypothetical protein